MACDTAVAGSGLEAMALDDWPWFEGKAVEDSE